MTHRRRRRTPLAALFPLAALAALSPLACHRDAADAASSPNAAPVAVAELRDDAVVGAVLAHCQPGLVGMDRVAARVWLPDATELQVFAALPDRLRVQFPDGGIQVLDGERCGRFVADSPLLTELSADAALRLRVLARLLDAAALGPLHRALGCTRSDERTWSLAQPQGEPVALTLAATALLAVRLQYPDTDVRIDDHLRTSTTWIVSAATVAPLGSCRIRFDSVDCAWGDAMFAAKAGDTGATSPPAGEEPRQRLTVGAPVQPRQPALEEVRATRWLVVDDPIDWTERAATVQRCLRELAAEGQQMAGFAGLLQDGERARLVVPFRAEPGHADYDAPRGADVRTFAAGQALVVFPAAGDLQQRCAEGERLLREALQRQHLEPLSPILMQPYVHLDQGPPDAEASKAPVVRVSVFVR